MADAVTDPIVAPPNDRQVREESRRQPYDLPFGSIGPVLEVSFETLTTRDITHGLGEVPDGVLILMATGGWVESVTPHLWTKEIALLAASDANTRARVAFVTFRERIQNA